MHYRARSYDPRIGRFAQPEPVTSRRIEEHYAYVSGQPTALIDPSGLQAAKVTDLGKTQKADLSRLLKKAHDWTRDAETVLILMFNDIAEGVDPSKTQRPQAGLFAKWFGVEIWELAVPALRGLAIDKVRRHYTSVALILAAANTVDHFKNSDTETFRAATNGNVDMRTPREREREDRPFRPGAPLPPTRVLPGEKEASINANWRTELSEKLFWKDIAEDSGYINRVGVLIHEMTHLTWDTGDQLKPGQDKAGQASR